MLVGILIAGLALVGLGGTTTLLAFYTFYLMNALGYVFGGPLPNQVMLSRWFDAGRGKAMGIAYLGIGVGGALVPLLAHALTEALGWRTALQVLGVLMIVIAFPLAFFVREPEARGPTSAAAAAARPPRRASTRSWTSCASRPSTCSPSAAWPRSARSAAPCRT